MELAITEVARVAGTTSRTLRHYDAVGILKPSRIGHNGYRFYDDRALIRLQRILLLRELGLGLDAIAEVLSAQDERSGAEGSGGEAEILSQHLELLRRERLRIEAQIASVQHTIAALQLGGGRGRAGTRKNERKELMAEKMFDGFDHTEHREEVERRWGAEAYAKSDDWWRGLGEDGRADWKAAAERLGADWTAAAEAGIDPASKEAQRLAARHVEWLRAVPGTPAAAAAEGAGGAEGGVLAGYVLGLGEMYVADKRFAANYGGAQGAAFVCDALRTYVARELA